MLRDRDQFPSTKLFQNAAHMPFSVFQSSALDSNRSKSCQERRKGNILLKIPLESKAEGTTIVILILVTLISYVSYRS